MTDAEWVKKIKVMGVEELFAEVMARPEFLTDYYYRDLGNAIRARYDQLQAAALTPPLFLLHCGKIDSGGEQDEWDTEADSGRRVDEFARRHPGQTIGLYAGAAPTAPAPIGESMHPTGEQPKMMQDESRELSRWLSTTPDARSHAKEAADIIAAASIESSLRMLKADHEIHRLV